MNLRVTLLIGLLITAAFFSKAQNSVGIGVASPNSNAVLELVSPGNNQGLLIPKLTTVQRTASAFVSALSSKENGLLIFDQDENRFYYWEVSQWQPLDDAIQLIAGSGLAITGNTIEAIPQDLELTGSTLTITNNPASTPINLAALTGVNTDDQTLVYDGATGELSISRVSNGPQSVTLTPSGSAGGDLTGTYPNPTIGGNAVASAEITDGSIVDADVSNTASLAVAKFSIGTNGQVLTTSGGIAQWANPSGSVLINNAGTRNLFAGEFVGGTTGGTDNAFFGAFAGGANTTGNYNVIVGTQAGQNKTTGDLNTLIGWMAGLATSHLPSFNGNTFLGAQAGQNTTGGPNTFLGEKSGQNNTTGTENLFAGNRSGITNTNGGQNTILGYFSDVSAAGLQNATAIGYNTVVNASDKVRIGNSSVTVIEGQVAFTAASDRRLKTEIKNLDTGLDFILKLKPVSYQMKNLRDKRTNWGFIAQDIEKIVGTSNAILTVGGDDNRTLGLRYTDFVAPLVKAVQEQQKELEDLKTILLKREQQILELERSLQYLKAENAQISTIKEDLAKIKNAMGIEAVSGKK